MRHTSLLSTIVGVALVTLGACTHAGPTAPPPSKLIPDTVRLSNRDVVVPANGGWADTQFSVDAGRTIRIILQSPDTQIEPYGGLASPGGTGIDAPPITTARNGANIINETVSETGTYTLTVFDGSNRGGTVHVQVLLIPQ